MSEAGLSPATWIAGLLALFGPELGGAVVAQNFADEFLAALPASMAPRLVSASLSAEALTGSLDLAATLANGKPVHSEGLLARHACLCIRRAEALEPGTASLLAGAIDAATNMVVAVIDPLNGDESLNPKLAERLAFRVESPAARHWTSDDIALARGHLRQGPVPQKLMKELCATALALGVASPRAAIHCVAAARGIAALQGRHRISAEDMAQAASLVLAHRATRLPAPETEAPEPPPPQDQAQNAETPSEGQAADAEVILEAVKAALPPDLLSALADGAGKRAAGRNMKGAGQRPKAATRGKRLGHRRASSLAGQRLDILATLRVAAPWQPLRRKLAGQNRLVVLRDDFRIMRLKQRNEATAIFAVDASGSTAFQRLAEAKGAVETILADCYVRRDRAALIAFRSKTAEILLPPTRSLERARRALAALAGGGGTPLAAGLDRSFELALQVRRAGGNPLVILLTDGRGNVTRAGEGNRVKALEEAQAAARLFAAEGFEAMIIDVSPEPQKQARLLAEAMQARYLAMPRAGASEIARPVAEALKSAAA